MEFVEDPCQAMSLEVCSSLINYCRSGNLEDVRHILSSHSLSAYPEWFKGYLLICEALKNKETEVVKLLLQYNAEINSYGNDDTPLHYAVRTESIEMIEILLDKNANINATNGKKRTPLYLAIDRRNEEIVKLLLKKGANVELTDKHGYSSLHLAVKKGSVKIVQHLINYGADVNFCFKNYSPLYFAVKYSSVKIVELLIQNGATVNPSFTAYYALLQLAIHKNNRKIVQLLLENAHSPGKKMESSEKTSRQILELLDCSVNNCRQNNDDVKSGDGSFTISEINDHELMPEVDSPEGEEEQQVMLEKSSYINETKAILKLGTNSKNLSTLLHTALTMKRINIVELLLIHGLDVNVKNELGRTPMYYACRYNDLRVCKYLLANGACINSKIDGNLNLLHVAVENTDEQFAKFLLNEGADVNATTNDNCTALHIACGKGCERIVRLLLKHQVNVHTKNNEGLSAFHEAVKLDNEKIVKLLMREGSAVNDTTVQMSTPLHFATQYNQERVVQRLLKYGADVNAKDIKCKTALCYAVETGNVNIIRLLLNKNLDVNDRSNKLAFCLAILQNDVSEDINIVEIFSFRGFTINSEDFKDMPIPEPLYSRYMNDYNKEEYFTVFQGLLKSEPSINTFFEYQILRTCVEKGFVKIIKALLRRDVNLNILLEESWTLLHIAIQSGQFWIAEELLKRGADVNCVDLRGRTPLQVSVLNSFTDIVAFLLKYKVDIEARDEDGKTALHLASYGKDHIIKLILDAGANTNSLCNNGSAPLHIASEGGHEKVVELLLSYDAEIDIKNRSNETPLDLAIYWQREGVTAVLLDHGATFRNWYHSEEIYRIIMEHSIKLQAISINNSQMNFDQKFEDFLLKCKTEIQQMVLHTIGPRVSLYDVLTEEDHTVEKYMRNEHIFNFFDSDNFENSYPIYASMLKTRFTKAKTRNLLIELGGNSLEYMLKIKIPFFVSRKMLSHVNNLDLRNLIQASRTD